MRDSVYVGRVTLVKQKLLSLREGWHFTHSHVDKYLHDRMISL
jgi:hypothetical protein